MQAATGHERGKGVIPLTVTTVFAKNWMVFWGGLGARKKTVTPQ